MLLVGLLGALLFSSLFLSNVFLNKGVEELVSLNVLGVDRNYLLYKPRSYKVAKTSAAVIVLHGGGESARYMINETGWIEKADNEGFLVIFPEGTYPDAAKLPGFKENQKTWRDGAERFYHHEQQGINDIAFIDAIITELIRNRKVSPERVFVTGFSNGASMALRLGVELSARIKAIAPVAGGLWLDNPVLQKPVSLIYISGTKDSLPSETTVTFGTGTKYVKAPNANIGSTWASMLACKKNVLHTNTEVVGWIHWSECEGNAEILLYSVKNIGHVWPKEGRVTNGITETFDATDVIWDFFESKYEE